MTLITNAKQLDVREPGEMGMGGVSVNFVNKCFVLFTKNLFESMNRIVNSEFPLVVCDCDCLSRGKRIKYVT